MRKYEIDMKRWGDNEECPEIYEILSGFCSFHEVRKAGKLRLAKVNIRIKKGLMKHGECVLHKVLNSYLVLAILRLPLFALLTGLEDA